ncbi:MAG TPA: prolipoprotein diacylglyceryl transferase [Patescibacteria group bacterium]|nr:prolipoprotein diacylglyceryl transferase [Patescibacteria group bacterium]
MHPILIELGKLKIYSYGFMLALSFFVGIQIAGRRAEKSGVRRETIYDLSIVLILCAVLGSRGLYIITHRNHFHSVLDIIALWQGGATYYGGLILAITGAIIYLRRARVPFFAVADICSPPIALGIFLTRIGCFLSGCCFGKPTAGPLGIVFPHGCPAGYTYPGEAVHPTQLYASLYGLVIFLALLAVEKKKFFEGYTFSVLCVLYGIARFGIDFFRYYEKSAMVGGVLTINQMLSLGLIGTGLFLFVLLSRRRGAAGGTRS